MPKKKIVKSKEVKKKKVSSLAKSKGVAAKKKVVRAKKKVSRKGIRRVAKKVLKKAPRPLDLNRSHKNPILGPSKSHWESEAVFNPGAVVEGDRVHLFYRALGGDGVSRVGYASSSDGIHFDKRSSYPVYMPESEAELAKNHKPFTSPARLAYDRALYASGGGWGGCEDPRAVKINDRVYMTFNMFNGWYCIRVGLTSIRTKDLENENWKWNPLVYLSPNNQRHKNWVLFPEKINGKFALLHSLHHPEPDQICIEFVDDIEKPLPPFNSHDPQMVPDRLLGWHHRMRSVGPPPVKTKYGWLIFYHGMDKNDPNRYKLGAMLVDPNDPRKILYRSPYPILEPDEWYENDWKPGIIYASGAVVKEDTLFIYYGGGDKYVGVAYTNINDFVEKLKKNEHIVLSKKTTLIK